MLRSYFLLAMRNFRRQPGYVLLNVLGLTIGITATLFILLYMTEETRYDEYHEHADRIYRVSSNITEPDDAFKWASTQSPLGMQLKADYPEVEEYVRFIPNGRTRFAKGDQFFYYEDVYVVDSTVNDVFTFEWIRGSKDDVLIRPNSVALSQSVAQGMFGNNDPLGEIISTPSGREYTVTGVYRDQPGHSHIIANALITANTIDGLSNPGAGAWGGFYLYTYVKLMEGTDASAFEAKLDQVIEQYVAVIFDQMDIKIKYEVMPITDIHLKSDYDGEPTATGDVRFLYIFGAVAFFMLLIACINYMNLATARSTKRSLEVGIRKVLGSERRQLVVQFLSESVIFTMIAAVISYALILLLLPTLNQAFDLSLERDLVFAPQVLGGILVVIVFTGVVGGSYPAFYLSGFRPISVLKGKLGKGVGNPTLRKGLVGVQFAVTLFMIVGTGVIYDQMQYLRSKDLGFDKENILTFRLQGQETQQNYRVIRDRLLQNPKITMVASAQSSPGFGYGKQIMIMEREDGTRDEYGVDNYGVDFDFFITMGMQFVEGRSFQPNMSTDSNLAVVVNEAMVERMGWTDPIGKMVQTQGVDTMDFARVVGVVNDFHQQSLYNPIEAILFVPTFNNGVVHARLNPASREDLANIIGFIEREWNGIFPGRPFEYDFVDSAFMDLYQADRVRAHIFTLFSILMIFIACLGLLGLASFTAEQRTKELGVRKILGAETGDLVFLLTRNFMFLVAVASVPAFFAAWYFMRQWLDTFHYHTNLNYWLFGIALIMVLTVTLLTTGYFALRAAHRNPVNSLRYE